MIAGIMQPYLFPYVGYFQLMAACDVFVLHDDVQFTKGGWIHRNRILLNGQPRWLTMPVAAGSHSRAINQRDYARSAKGDSALLRKIAGAYAAAPFVDRTITLLETVFRFPSPNIAMFNEHTLRVLANFLNITTPIGVSSELPKDNSLRGQERVIAICKALGANKYINAPGGTGLYDSGEFARNGLALEFLKPSIDPYPQLTLPFVPALSIIDVLMFNDAADASALVHRSA